MAKKGKKPVFDFGKLVDWPIPGVDQPQEPELMDSGKPKRSMYPVEIARMLHNGIARMMVSRFYHSIGDMVIDELERDLNMASNHARVTQQRAAAIHMEQAALAVRNMRRVKQYPSEVRFK